jgi:AcrR family transcriptional regulator
VRTGWHELGPRMGGNRFWRNGVLAKAQTRRSIKPRERLLDAAYDLFATHGIGQVGIDTILAKSGCAKASLYSYFQSKVDLAVAFLDRREAASCCSDLE